MSAKCLNCETELQGAYCHRCGQKASTHRITFAKFLQHDLLHGIFHLDKGILYTLKSLISRPGYTARNFIEGKRVLHYNIFALFIIVVVVKTVIDWQISPGSVFESSVTDVKTVDEQVNNTIIHYYKFFYLLCIPLLSVFSFVLLRRLKYNFTEHIVANCFFLTGGFFYALPVSVLAYFLHFDLGDLLGLLFVAVYLFICYYQLTVNLYKFWDYLWRAVAIIILFVTALILTLGLIILCMYNGNFEGSIAF